jgi:ATP-dependent Lon protease
MTYNLRKRPPPSRLVSEESDDESDDDESSSECELSSLAMIGAKYRRFMLTKPNSRYSTEERAYIDSLDSCAQIRIAEIEDALDRANTVATIPIRFRIVLSAMDDGMKAFLLHKVERFNAMTSDASEYFKMKQWIESVVTIPFNVHKGFPVSKTDPCDRIVGFMNNTKAILDKTVYGHDDSKKQILRIVAQWISNPTSQGYAIGLCGPPGVGKTSLIKDGLSKALDIPFGFIALGGASDSSFIDGHCVTYEGSTYGKIVEMLIKTKVNNPIVLFDELDKVSSTDRGNEIISALTHITDSSQNKDFNDKYFSGISIDLSRCIFVFSYNNESLIDPILKDRMIQIKVSGYKTSEKVVIARDYMLKKIYETFGFDEADRAIVITTEIIEKIIEYVPKEDGVRNLKRGLESVVSWINMYSYTGEMPITYPFVVTEAFAMKHVLKTLTETSNIITTMYM